MLSVNVTEFRNHLQSYLKKVSHGEELAITSRGKVVARLVPELDQKAAATERLKKQRGAVIQGDIVSPINLQWTADEDNL